MWLFVARFHSALVAFWAARSRRERLLLVGAALALAAGLAGLVLFASLPDVRGLADQNPPTTAVIDQRAREAKEAGRPFRPRQHWRSLDQLSPLLVWAVVLSEDAGFYGHSGIDWYELEQAVKKNLATQSYARGASTLTQQLAKNLYLGTHKSLWRKLKEALIARRLEEALSKKRILTLYFNVAEWGDGVFGAEAGARKHFGVSAAALSPAQVAMMVAMLPAPRGVDVEDPTARFKARARRSLRQLAASGRLSREAAVAARAELEHLLEDAPLPQLPKEEPEGELDEVAVEPEPEPDPGLAPEPEPELEPEVVLEADAGESPAPAPEPAGG